MYDQSASPTNEEVLASIQGTGARPQQTTLGTGMGASGLPGAGAQTQSNMNYANTQQQFFSPTAYNPYQPAPYQPQIRHGIGKDQWNSNIGLDQQAILNSLGLGGS